LEIPREIRSTLDPLSTDHIYERLRAKALDGETQDVDDTVKYLLVLREEEPNLQMYSALILSQINPITGSALMVESILNEISDEGLSIDSGICEDALKALAVHNDHVLRDELLEYMKDKFIEVSPTGHHYIIAGLLRESQFELALETIDKLESSGIVDIRPWLLDMAIFMLLDVGEVDQAFHLLQLRLDKPEIAISHALWYQFLDAASAEDHYEATRWIWTRRVQTSYLNPPTGVCLAVLATASRHADPHLATDVFRVLGTRKTEFELEHYELLMEAYVSAGELEPALSVLSVMAAAGCEPVGETSRAIYEYLRTRKDGPDEAWRTLRKMKDQFRLIPIEAANVIIESCTALENLDQALTYYKQIPAVVSPLNKKLQGANDGKGSGSSTIRWRTYGSPNTRTFNILLREISRRGRKDLATFLASEMRALGIPPDALTYDRIIITCLK
ncbi:hypothetical protein K402DRAFT_300827, partial [Aulographum hederae CBS 113979]